MILKTKERQQPQDTYEVLAYTKPLHEFGDSGISAGDNVTFKYYSSTVYPDYLMTTSTRDEGVSTTAREPINVIYYETTGIVGGFSIHAGEEVIWLEISGGHESFNRDRILDIVIQKPKKVKKVTKKVTKPVKKVLKKKLKPKKKK